MEERFSDPRLTVVLADAAQAVDGKLYIMGGGWTQIIAHNPTNMSLAMQLVVPWSRANETFRVKAFLTSQDSDEILNIGYGPVLTEIGTEVGRPPGLQKGTSLVSTFVFDFPQIALPPGGFVWHVHLNDQEVHSSAFSAANLGLPPPQLPQQEQN